mgnify:FL=1
MIDAWANHFQFMARYNRWANRRLYDSCEALPKWEYLKLRQAFFSSIHGTLSHLLVGDLVWFARFLGEAATVSALDEQPHATLAELRMARDSQDEKIITYIDGLSHAEILGTISYARLGGERYEDELRPLLTHVFNHQTHHRGQVHGMLSGTSVEPPLLDIIYYMREAQ